MFTNTLESVARPRSAIYIRKKLEKVC